jgi:putative heme-binding domain-containing protein
MVSLSQSKQQDVLEKASYWLAFRQSNDWFNLLDWSKISLNTAYERKLAEMKVKKSIVLDDHQSIYERKHQISEMSIDSVGGQMVIGMAEEKTLPKDLFHFVEEKIFSNPDATVRMQAGNYFKHAGADHTYSVQNILAMKSDGGKGKTVFIARCATCHKFGNDGKTIGPDLSGIGKKFDKPALLDAIVNPSAAIVFGYEPWLVNTSDGATVYGFLLSENKQAIVVKDIAGQKHTIDIKKITSRKKEEKSLMPDPVSNGLSEQDLADIVEFLSSGASTAQGR